MDLYEETQTLYQTYRGEKRIIGHSREGRDIYAFFMGKREKPVTIAQYAIHAREYVTTRLAFYHLSLGVARGGCWVVPLANPDGALLCTYGILSIQNNEQRKGLLQINGSSDFSLWKANAVGVDLNVNFAAHWGTGEKNVKKAAAENYIGLAPFSEPESRALKNFTYAEKPDCTFSFHTKGEEIYYAFHQNLFHKTRDKRLARILQKSTGYPIKNTPRSAGGYKDWCIQTFQIPSFTIEAGREGAAHPLGEEELENVIARCGNVLRDFHNEY